MSQNDGHLNPSVDLGDDWEFSHLPDFESGGQVRISSGAITSPLTPEERDGLIPTHITLRSELNELEQKNIAEATPWQVAANCRTSVEMIEKFYARHIKDAIDAAQVNVMQPRAARSAVVPPIDQRTTERRSRRLTPRQKPTNVRRTQRPFQRGSA